MNRTTLERILAHAGGVARVAEKSNDYTISEGHRVTFYIGRPGQAMEISDLGRCTLHDDFVVLEAREGQGEMYVDCESIHAVRIKPPRADESRRTGF